MDPDASSSSSTSSHSHGVVMIPRDAAAESASRLQTVASAREGLHARPREEYEARAEERQEHKRHHSSSRSLSSLCGVHPSHEYPLRRLQDTSATLLPSTPASDADGVWGAPPRRVGKERTGGAPQVHQWPADTKSSQQLTSRLGADGAFDRRAQRSDSFASSCSSLSEQDRSLSASNGGGNNSSSTINSKTSRYLREMDRRDILHRIRQGEKQSALAKEYHISRSAVCNLNKKRDAVLARKCANPLAKHPKLTSRRAGSEAVANVNTSTPEHSTTQVQARLTVSTAGGSTYDDYAKANTMIQQPPGGLHVMKATHRPVPLLLSRLQSSETTENEFRRCTDRIMRLVLEEAMALVQLQVAQVDLHQREGSFASSLTSAGVVAPHPSCALSLEQNGCPMLDLFNLLEPDLSTGYVRIQSLSQEQSVKLSATILQAHLPRDLSQHNVLLLDTVVTSGEELCCAIEKVRTQLGGVERRISVVTLFISGEAAARVANRYPLVRIVAADQGFPSESGNGSAATREVFSQRMRELV